MVNYSHLYRLPLPKQGSIVTKLPEIQLSPSGRSKPKKCFDSLKCESLLELSNNLITVSNKWENRNNTSISQAAIKEQESYFRWIKTSNQNKVSETSCQQVNICMVLTLITISLVSRITLARIN